MQSAVALFLALLVACSLAAPPSRAQDGIFTFASVEAMAAKLAGEPYRESKSIAGPMRELGYDQYRALRWRTDTAVWRDANSPFRVEFFPAGFIYDKPVAISVIEDGTVRPVGLSPDNFDFSDTGLKAPPGELALAGFRITHPLHGPDKFDEIVSFLGASYFRAIGRGQVYGTSIRGLAVDTASGRPEEFPAFREFWILKPGKDAASVTVWALLDSPSVAGAFSFVIRPGKRTVVDTHAILHLRRDVGTLGIAPLTSMYFAGKTAPSRDDYRPEIHDADGLALHTGKGEHIWRPLSNPSSLAVSSFADTNPRGFGLLQRERDFVHYQDTGANLQDRPSIWIEPKDDWGDGEVRLVEIPSQAETNDNVVAFWVSRWPAKQRERKEYRYRVFALADEPASTALARVVATRSGAVPDSPRQRRLVVEFAGGELEGMAAAQPVTANVSLTTGRLMRTYVEPLPARARWRVFIDFEPDGRKPTDLRATLELRGTTLTETWIHTWRP
ncbi:MAG: glucan biosynthesis protein [Enhydrobacter sp.]|nr:MAG: glucan biosynthesis protein [Enhydrobacter sp.]